MAGGQLVMISGGEPLLREDITDMLKIIRDLGLEVALNTNGILLGQQKQQLFSLCSTIVVSMDAADDSLYKKIRGCGALGRVIEGVKHVQSLLPSLEIQFRCTISRYNLFNFSEVINLAKTLGIAGVGFSPIDYDSNSFGRDSRFQSSVGRERLIPSSEEIERFNKLLDGELGEFLEKAYNEKVISWSLVRFRQLSTYLLAKFEGRNQGFSDEPCFFPHTATLVDYGGEVKHCFYSSSYARVESVSPEELVSSDRISCVRTEGKCRGCRGQVFT
jgi:MoaA/NifB/PqqE/SkfB family radical SAM enzyme